MSIDADIVALIRQEEALRFKGFDEVGAWTLGQQMQARAVAKKLPLVIDIRVGARPLFYAALPGTTSDNHDWVQRKIRTVMRFERCSYRVSREHEKKNAVFSEARGLDPILYALAGGGFPVHVKGTGVVGTVTVSGIPQRDDHNFVAECISHFLDVDYTKIALAPEPA